MKSKFYAFLSSCLVLLLTAVTATAQNIALGKPAVASSTQDASFPPALSVDGQGTGGQVDPFGNCQGSCTRWSSGYALPDPQWIYVDLGGIYSLTEVRVYWEAAWATNYDIQISNDASTWTTVQTVTNNN